MSATILDEAMQLLADLVDVTRDVKGGGSVCLRRLYCLRVRSVELIARHKARTGAGPKLDGG